LDAGAVLAFVRRSDGVALLFVDDGSTDQTAARLAELSAQAPGRIGWLRLPTNQGKAGAVRAGVLAAMDGARFVGFWDADLSTPLEEIPRFVAFLEARPALAAAIGARVQLLGSHITRSTARHYLGRVFATAASIALRLAVYDTQCGAKLFRVSPLVRTAFAQPFHTRWIFDVEVLARLGEASHATGGLPLEQLVVELPLDKWVNVGGSKLNPLAMVRAGLALTVVRGHARRDISAAMQNPLVASDEGGSHPVGNEGAA
jgi:glycosyltransferase involved in cell wall biosynthesis